MRGFCQLLLFLSLVLFASLGWPQGDNAKPQVPLDLKRFVIGDPPEASARVTFPHKSKLLQQESLGSTAQALSDALNSKGYADQKWFVVSHGGNSLEGIAVMTRLERINDTGKPLASERFSQDSFTPEISSLTEYFKRLLANGSKGRYRSFLFYLTFTPSPRQQAPPRIEEMNNAFLSGAAGGPAFEKMNISLPLTCTAYIYEFERKVNDGQPSFITNDAMSGQAHLVAADLWAQLGPE